jgi:hypothetical protein
MMLNQPDDQEFRRTQEAERNLSADSACDVQRPNTIGYPPAGGLAAAKSGARDGGTEPRQNDLATMSMT